MEEKIPIRYIVLPITAILLAVMIVVLSKTGNPGGLNPGGKTTPTPPETVKVDEKLFSLEEKDDKTYSVLGFSEEYEEQVQAGDVKIRGFSDGLLYIPGELAGKKITTVERTAFQGNTAIKKVVIGEGVTEILDYAFEGCEGMVELSLPETLKTVNDSAFYGCKGLKSVVIPKNAKKIENYAFAYCENLTELSVPFTSGLDDIFIDAPLKKVTITDGSAVAEDAFYMKHELETVIFESRITLINDYAFADCTSLKNIVLPDGLLSIGANAFEGCTALAKMVIPESVTFIGEFAFSGCEALKSANIPAGTSVIGQQAFDNCPELKLKVTEGSEGAAYAEKEDIPVEGK